MKVPCKDCGERTSDCHSNCKKYLRWSKERQKILDEQHKQKIIDQYFSDNIIRRSKKNRRYK